jgi:hypothetical protein
VVLGLANLSSWEVMTGSKRRRVLVEGWCAILVLRVFGKMWEGEVAWLLWLALFLEVAGIHCELLSIVVCKSSQCECNQRNVEGVEDANVYVREGRWKREKWIVIVKSESISMIA